MYKNYSSSYCTVALAICAVAVFAFVSAGPDSFLVQTADARAGSYVETITFSKHTDHDTAVDTLIAGEIDMYYESVSASNLQKITDAGHDLYQSTSGATYLLALNPTDDHTNGFNPFAYQKVRFAVNYMIDRDYIVENIFGSGAPMDSTIAPNSQDYLLVYEYLESLGFEYDLQKADLLIKNELEAAGATKSDDDDDGKWYYEGKQITLKVVVRGDDAIRSEIGSIVVDSLEKLGFGVSVTYVDLSGAFDLVAATDPADQQWHLYTNAFLHVGYTTHYDDELWLYAPQSEYLPGRGVDDYWNYEHDELDKLMEDMVDEKYESPEQRAQWLLEGIKLGVEESVNVSIGVRYDTFPVRGDVTGVINSQTSGMINRYTPLTVQFEDSRTDLDIGMRHVVQSSWNPIGGFTDTYSSEIWDLLYDVSFANNPHTREILDARNMIVSVETNGPDGKITIPSDALIWNENETSWTRATETEAVSKVTFDIRFANWHNGQPMDLNDLLYPVVFNREHTSNATYLGEPFDLPDFEKVLYGASPDLVGFRIIDNDTIETYTTYWHSDPKRIAQISSLWTVMPWEVYHAMDMAVHEGTADWHSHDASARSDNWIDLIDPDDADLILSYLETAREKSDVQIPVFLYTNMTSEYVKDRYDATIAWIAEKRHAAISNGPFYLSGPIIRDADGIITEMTITQFDDHTYPFGPQMWSAFTEFEPTGGEIVVGSLAPISGNAHKYGAEMQGVIDLAVLDFNRYADQRGLDLSIALRHLDTETSPDTAHAHLERLSADGVNLVLGPSIDIITHDMVRYADENDMLLLSCCSSVPSLAIPDDSLYRMLPDQRVHAQAIVNVMSHSNIGIKHVIPVGIDAAWATELLEESRAQFETSMITVSSDIIKYTNPLRDSLAGSTIQPTAQGGGDNDVNLDDAAGMLAARVQDAVSQYGARNVAILYVGFGEGPEFLKAASEHDILYDVRWFGADQNTAYPNIADDPASAGFARTVQFTIIQPAVHELVRNFEIYDLINARLHDLGLQNSTYSKYAYDSVWLLGLSLIDAPSSSVFDVKSEITRASEWYVGSAGSAKLNENGDLDVKNPQYRYVSWQMAADRDMWIEYSVAADTGEARTAICR